MKKIYSLILLAAAALGANAQVVLTYQGKVLENNSTTEIIAQEETQEYTIEGEIYEFTNLTNYGTSDPKLLNQGKSNASVSVTVEAPEDWQHFMWCGPRGMTNLCQPLKSATETRSGSIAAGEEVELVLDAEFGEYGEYGAEYYATRTAKVTLKSGSTTNVYTLKFVYDERSVTSGIQSVTNAAPVGIITDLQGRRVAQPQAGSLYIQNGRKFIQK